MTGISLDKVVVVDLEATCWKKEPPPGEMSEIIEIGVCLLDIVTLTLSDPQGILVKPSRSKVSHFCTKLTSLTQSQVDAGLTFADACERLQVEYVTKDRLWCSWGDYDRKMFQKQCESFNVSYPFGDAHCNLKAIFAEHFNKGKKTGLMRGLKMLEVEPEGRHHRGVDDAWNTARALAKMLERVDVAVLAAMEIEE